MSVCTPNPFEAHGTTGPGHAELPADPFTALQFHFGMLLGVDDLETLAANPRGKMRLHNAWLHRAGVVWGLGVGLQDNGELRVGPGLAVDGAGRELRLDVASCLDFGRWYQTYHSKFVPPLTPDAEGVVTFDAHVVARFRACLARPVPAISEPCSDTVRDVAWSRAQETMELALVPGPAPARETPYPRLRLLFGLRAPDAAVPEDLDIVARRDAVLAGPEADRAAGMLALFRELSVKDTRAMLPADDADGARTLFPIAEPAEVVLAEITGVRVKQQPDGSWRFDDSILPTIREDVRPVHVATTTVQELLCGHAGAAGMVADAGGPRVRTGSVQFGPDWIKFETTTPVLPASVTAGAFEVTTFDPATGWTPVDIDSASASGDVVTVELDGTLSEWVRLIVRGTGPTPLLGDVGGVLVPFAGAEGGPPSGAHDGRDFILMHKGS